MTSTILPQQIEKINSFFQKNEKNIIFYKKKDFSSFGEGNHKKIMSKIMWFHFVQKHEKYKYILTDCPKSVIIKVNYFKG